jgi:hypothetical protein
MSSTFEVYKDYLALRNHFTKPEYDYIKYNGKIKANEKAFESRKDKFFFQKLAKRPDYHNFLIANLSYDPSLWIRDLAYSEEADARYNAWKKRQQSLSYVVKSELSQLNSDFDSNFKCGDEHPPLFKLYLGGHISLETLCILLSITGALKHWDKAMEYDLIWRQTRLKIVKYIPFINYDHNKIKSLILDYFSNT